MKGVSRVEEGLGWEGFVTDETLARLIGLAVETHNLRPAPPNVDADAANLALVAEVITAYIRRDGALRRHQLSVQTVKTRLYSLRLVELRRERGLANGLEHQDAISLVQQSGVEIERIELELRQTGNALALLVGVPSVSDFLPALPGVDPFVVQDIAAGMPASLLASRPDIRDVADALAANDSLRRQIDAQQAQAQASAQHCNLTELRYRSGIDDHLRFLDAQRADFANQITLIDLKTERQLALTTLFRSLGGRWPRTESAQREMQRRHRTAQ